MNHSLSSEARRISGRRGKLRALNFAPQNSLFSLMLLSKLTANCNVEGVDPRPKWLRLFRREADSVKADVRVVTVGGKSEFEARDSFGVDGQSEIAGFFGTGAAGIALAL